MRFFYNLGRDRASTIYRIYSVMDIVAGIIFCIASVAGGIVTCVQTKVGAGFAVLFLLLYILMGVLGLIGCLISSGVAAALADTIDNASGGVYESSNDSGKIVRLEKEIKRLSEALEKEKSKSDKNEAKEEQVETAKPSIDAKISSPEPKDNIDNVLKDNSKPKLEKATIEDIKVGTKINYAGMGQGVVISISGSGDCTIRWNDKTESTIDLSSSIERGVIAVEK